MVDKLLFQYPVSKPRRKTRKRKEETVQEKKVSTKKWIAQKIFTLMLERLTIDHLRKLAHIVLYA